MQTNSKPAPAPTEAEKDRLRQKLLRLIVKSESQRRVTPGAKRRMPIEMTNDEVPNV